MPTIQVADIDVEVVQKDIKNIHLSVYPPDGRVKVSAPERFDMDTLRVYIISKLSWIRQQQEKQRAQKREAPREFINRESHYLFGKRYMLKVVEADGPASVDRKHSTLVLKVRPGCSEEKRKEVMDNWYRGLLKKEISELVSKWQKPLGVEVAEFGVKKMRTKWGTCNSEARRIWINLELAKKPRVCLEYIVVHEMVHILERTHSNRFVALMDHHMPQWRLYREELNRLPISHVDWGY